MYGHRHFVLGVWTHMSSLISLTCELCQCHLKVSSWSNIDQSPHRHTHTHKQGVYSCPIMTNHPFQTVLPQAGCCNGVSPDEGRGNPPKFNTVTAVPFMSPSCFISLRSLCLTSKFRPKKTKKLEKQTSIKAAHYPR